MYKKTVNYTDYNGIERSEAFYFNLNEAEITEMQLTTAGGYAETVQAIVDAKDTPALVKIFKELIFKAYGEKSADGRRFMKSEQLSREFSETPAYSIIFMELATDDKAAAEFINQVVPAEMAKNAAVQMAALQAGKPVEVN